ncbi:S1 family peptidase [Actinomadura rubrisoli]|uniref:S1 family peptidase n=1 Tax=Actinomadura rubrisoli TaxID=2530368 RepID=A0A4R5BNR5_9ACTN|nr:S1 family peptidase [Actinomadura rubrisoli]TDD87535.1 S1 family peptidase [Actinomadura rubrisoli]
MNRGMHLKRAVPSLLSAAALLAAGASPVMAQTQPAGTIRHAQLAQEKLADQLTGRLGSQHAGSYLDGTGNLVVNVTTKAAAEQVKAAGVKARIVKHGIKPLDDAKAKLDRFAGTKGTTGMSWGVDVITNAVVVNVPKDDNDAATKAFVKRARSISPTVEIKRVAGPARLALGPGDAITTSGSRCSISAFAVSGSTEYVVTAGHCTAIGATWSAGGQVLGTRQASSFPGNDYGTLRKTGSQQTSNANLTTVGRPAVGTQIQKKGSTTGTTSGTIRAYGRTVNYQQGAVTDLIATTACAQPGDSGGSLQGGSVAIGITSGISSSSCSGSGFESYFQPLDEALQSQNITLKTG